MEGKDVGAWIASVEEDICFLRCEPQNQKESLLLFFIKKK
jgi:hypothetical protein